MKLQPFTCFFLFLLAMGAERSGKRSEQAPDAAVEAKQDTRRTGDPTR